ncbi:MAG TPA: amino acid adenylation domain-containing protein [Pyrinomonadaceae bacterium]|nr:amino acid adenylation domain-containing protein [Pyrinomonadaceae bacterium]
MSDLSTRTTRFSGDKRRLYEMLLKEKGVRVPQHELIPRRKGNSPPPLSFAQLRLWFLDQMETENAYYVPLVKRLVGELDFPVLQRSINEIVRRHEVLRTSFPAIDGEPRQLIAAPREFQVEQLDLSQLPPDERENEAGRLVVEESIERGFDLRRGPLMRAIVYKLAPREHILLIAIHHVIADGWSMGVLLNELATLYNAYRRGEQTPLAELPIQYADYAVWQRDYLQGAVLDRQLDYWKQQLDGVPVLELPVDRVRSSQRSNHGLHESFVLPNELANQLQIIGRREGATLFMVLLAGFQLLLNRYSGQEDIVVGTPIAGRNRKETEGLIGFFINTLALRTDFSGNPSFRELLQRVSKVALDAYAHQDIPFQKLVQEIQPERSLTHQPLVQSLFSLQNAPGSMSEMDGIKLENFRFKAESTQFDLMLTMAQLPRGISGTLCYRTDLFEPGPMRTMARQYQTLLRHAVADPDTPVKQLAMLSKEERQHVVHEWNETATVVAGSCVHELFEQQVQGRPQDVALVSKERTLTYQEMNEQANRLAHWLIERGVGPESVVGILLDRSAALLISLLAVLKSGAAYVPLDPQQPGERLAYMLEDAGAGVLLTRDALVDSLPGYWGQTFCLDSEWSQLDQLSSENPQRVVSGQNLAYVIYTSGSTGRPKGVMIEHASLSNYLNWARDTYRLAAAEANPVHSSISFDLTVTSIYGPLISGGRVELVEEAEERAGSATALSAALARQGGYSFVKLTPAHLEVLRSQLSETEAARATRCLVVGGEQLRRETALWWRRHAPETRIINEYGPTEATVGCCIFEVGDEDPSSTEAIAIGRPIANTRLYVLDAAGEPAGIGVKGELYIGGHGLGRGYLGRADLTADRFVPDGLSGIAGARLYRTGDLARYRSNGVIECLGRADNQVKVRGYRIELGEIEAALNQCDGVKESVVLARESETGDKRLHAYLVALPDASIETNTLRNQLKTKVPDYMAPSAFFTLIEMPLTSNGKIDRQALLAVEQGSVETGGGYVAPTNAIEESLCDIWSEVLEVGLVGIHDNFFDIGGHSLLAASVLSRVAEVFGVELSLRTMFNVSTVAGLAAVLVDEFLQKEGTENVLKVLDEIEELEVVT